MDAGPSSQAGSNAANKVNLDLRNQRFSLDREALMELPESVLLCLFPNGVVLSRQGHHFGPGDEDDDEEEIFYVDVRAPASPLRVPTEQLLMTTRGPQFDGPCLSYILAFFLKARIDYYGTTVRKDEHPSMPSLQSPLFSKQAIIVLREELEYFTIPPAAKAAAEPIGTDADGIPTDDLLTLKRSCGTALLERKSIFTALQRNVNRENNVAEQHLIDMLCMSGFNREDDWGYRSLEPNRCCITSIALVLLKTGITHHPPPSSATSTASDAGASTPTGPDASVKTPPQVNSNQLATAQKLLLFWRKPAVRPVFSILSRASEL